MRRCEATIDDYVRSLDSRLRGPGRLKADLMTEIRHGLEDAAGAYVDGGLDERTAGRRAVADFGAPDDLAPAYQAELTAGYGRRLALTLVLLPVGMLTADLMWWQPPGEPSPPPAGFLVLVRALDWGSYVAGALALVALLLLGTGNRRVLLAPSLVVRPLVGVALVTCGLIWTLGVVAGIGAVVESPRALTWPPMIAAWIMLNATFGGIIWYATRTLAATRVREATA